MRLVVQIARDAKIQNRIRTKSHISPLVRRDVKNGRGTGGVSRKIWVRRRGFGKARREIADPEIVRNQNDRVSICSA